MNVNKNEVRTILRSKVEDRFNEYLDSYTTSEGIPSKFVPSNVLDNLVQEHVALDADDFIKNYPMIEEAEIYSSVLEFVDDSYDYDSFVIEYERKLDLDELRLNLQDDLVLLLSNTEPYGFAPRSYWDTRVRRIESIRELGKFVEDDLESFVVKYASNWQNDSREFSDE